MTQIQSLNLLGLQISFYKQLVGKADRSDDPLNLFSSIILGRSVYDSEYKRLQGHTL